MKVPMLLAVACLMSGWEPRIDSAPRDPDVQDSKASASYVGAQSCKACHNKQLVSWKKTSMAKAFDVLKPGMAVEAKKKFKLDEKADYTKDPSCLPCHTTGYGLPGGYPAVVAGKAWSDEETKRATLMEGIQCESCHGAASLSLAYKKANKQPDKAVMLQKGLVEPTEKDCRTCHNDKSATFDKNAPFDHAAAIKDDAKIHQHVKP